MDTKINPSVVEKAVALAGNVEILAHRCGVSVQAVYKWLRRGEVPLKRMVAVENAVDKKMSRFDFLPDDFQSKPLD